MSASDLTPPEAAYSSESTFESFCRITVSTSRITAGLVSLIRAIRSETSACCSSSSSASTSAASVVCRLEMTSALVCGASLRRKALICSGGVRCRNSNGRISITAESRPVISAALLRPQRPLQHVAGVGDAALGDRGEGERVLGGLLQHRFDLV